MSQDPRTFNTEDKVTWDELADSLQKLITQIKTDLANEIIDRKTACEKLQKEIDALFDKDGHLVFPNGNTIWIDANNGTLPSTGTGSASEVSNVAFDQLDTTLQQRLDDDKTGIAQTLSEIDELKELIQANKDEITKDLSQEIIDRKTGIAQTLSEIDELKKLIQDNTDEITKLKAQMEASGAAAAAGGGGNGMNLDFARTTKLPYVVTQYQTDGVHTLGYYTIPENGYVFIKISSYMVDDIIAHSKATYRSSFSIGNLSVDTGDYYSDKHANRCFPVSKDDAIHTSGEAYVVFIPLKK